GVCDDVVAERSAGVAETGYFGVDVVDDQVDAIPTTGSGLDAIRHGSSRGTGRPAEQQPQTAPGDASERRRGAGQHLEVEELRIEVNGLLNVIDTVAYVHHIVGSGHGFSVARWFSCWPSSAEEVKRS